MKPLSISINEKSYAVLDFSGKPRALLDRTVADIYGVETRHLNQAVSRNPKKFPEDFCFELTRMEAKSLEEKTNGQLIWRKGYLPKAFTLYGCNMLATVLESEIAVERSIQIVRAFSQLEIQGVTLPDRWMNKIVELVENLSLSVKNSQQQTSQSEMILSQVLLLMQNFGKLNERMNVLETKIEAVMKARGNFNENHWLFGKFTEIIAEGIDENRGKIENLETKVENLTQQKSKQFLKNSKIEKSSK